jgi:8-oxoguanine deaminase
MSSTLLKNADCVITMDTARREIAGGGLYIEDNTIVAVGQTGDLPSTADEIIDLAGHVVLPGLVNTHHHMFQSLTRVVPDGQNAELFDWLESLFPIWCNLTPEMVAVSTELAMAELLRSGCTTTSDHLYIYPGDCRIDDSIDAAARVGMRFHASRGSMSLGQSKGGLPPDTLVEDEDYIMKDCQRVIRRFHDPARYSMIRIALAPCSPYTVSEDLMRETAALARATGTRLHTHLAESQRDVAYSRDRDGRGALSMFQHATGIGHRARAPDAGTGRAGGPWRRWIGFQRCGKSGKRSAPGDAAATCHLRRRCVDGASGAGNSNTWRCAGSGAR